MATTSTKTKVPCVVCGGKANRDTIMTKKKKVVTCVDEYCDQCGYHYSGEDGDITERVFLVTLQRNFVPDDRDGRMARLHILRNNIITEAAGIWNTPALRFVRVMNISRNAHLPTLRMRLLKWLEDNPEKFPLTLEYMRQWKDRMDQQKQDLPTPPAEQAPQNPPPPPETPGTAEASQ